VYVSDQAASNGGEENGEIDRGLLKYFLLLRTVVPAVCHMGERVFPTIRTLSEAAKHERREGVIEPNDPYKQGRQGPRTS